MLTFEKIAKNEAIKAYIKKADEEFEYLFWVSSMTLFPGVRQLEF